MNSKQLKKRINSMVSHLTFEYQGKSCGVDPLSLNHFDIWCADEFATLDSIEKVMNTPFFDGKPLKDIAQNITLIEE